MSRVIVVGAGVVGLTCAVRLLEAGHRVDVLARDLPLETTSAVAAALWHPYGTSADAATTRWAGRSYDVFSDLAAVGATGVRLLSGTEVVAPETADPWWVDAVPALTRLPGAWTFVAPVVEMPVYLSWLHSRVEELGGAVTRLNLRVLPHGADLVVNCAGIGARLLAADPTVTPVRGQVVHVEQHGLQRWWLESGGQPLYVVPRERDIVVGGTYEEGDWSRTPSPETAELLVRRAAVVVPELATARVVRHRVGLRPARPSVRLERDGRVVHCYGHGGAGVTLSWGCADEVVALIG